MDFIATIIVLATFYLWPVVLSEFYLYRTKELATIKLRLKLYGISYAIWVAFNLGYSWAIHQISASTTRYAASCQMSERGCSQLYLETVESAHNWGAFFICPIAALCAWLALKLLRTRI